MTGKAGSTSYREFLLEFADYQLAYEAGGGINAKGNPIPDPARAINPPVRDEVGLPFIVEKAADCPGGVPLPCPEAVSSADPGTMSVNYRNEPVALRAGRRRRGRPLAGLPLSDDACRHAPEHAAQLLPGADAGRGRGRPVHAVAACL